jgi:hypothetical protein
MIDATRNDCNGARRPAVPQVSGAGSRMTEVVGSRLDNPSPRAV